MFIMSNEIVRLNGRPIVSWSIRCKVAVLMPDATDAADRDPRHIIVEGRNKFHHQLLKRLDWSYDPLQYALMFPRGEKGWAPQSIPLTYSERQKRRGTCS